MSQIAIETTRFINAEPGVLPLVQGPMPVVVLSFGAEDGPIEDRAVNIIEARQMVMDILESLAIMGDPLAQAIGKQFFSEPQKGSEPELDGNEFDDGRG